MAKTDFKNVDEYISIFPADVQSFLEKIRQTIRKAAPDAVETISYQVPAFKLNGRYLIYFAGYKHHVSIYPAPRGVAVFKSQLAKYKGGKGTVQFPFDKPLPLALISRIVKFRMNEAKVLKKVKFTR